MVGIKKHIASMWKKLGERLDLEPPVLLHGNVYLGCRQQNVPVPSLFSTKEEMYPWLLADTVSNPAKQELAPCEGLPKPNLKDVKGYAYDMHAICVWYANDMHMICVWYAYDIRIICAWYPSDMHLIYVWYMYDMGMISSLLPSRALNLYLPL